MAVENNSKLTGLFGMADVFALLSAAFAFTTAHLAEALVDGRFTDDLAGSLADMEVDDAQIAHLVDGIKAEVLGKAPTELLEELRIEYTSLYYGPGKFRKMYPYESPFQSDLTSTDSSVKHAVFVTRTTHDVERFMSRNQYTLENERSEPADSVDHELGFLSYLLANYASALMHEEDSSQAWRTEIEEFSKIHAEKWLPVFFEKTKEETENTLFALFAECGLLAMSRLKEKKW